MCEREEGPGCSRMEENRPSMSSNTELSSNAELGDVESNTESSESGVASILNYLKPPKASTLARKRKIAVNPPMGLKRSKGTASNDPKSVRPVDRVKSYPQEPFSVSNKKLFCLSCREELPLKKNSIDVHVKCTKHTNNTKRWKVKKEHVLDIAEALKDYQARVHPKGETLPESTRLFRVKVVTAMLRAGIPLQKADALREVFEENGYSLTDSSHLRELIPFVLEQETAQLKKEINGKHLSIIFDGTTHVCEALVIIVRYFHEWRIKQKVCRLMLLAKALTGEELARQLITAISTELSVQPGLVVAGMRDRASVNTVAMCTISVIYNNMMDIGCFSHTLDHVGEKMCTPTLDEFMTSLISLFSRSPKAKLIWRGQTGVSMVSYSSTRWWSKFEVIKQVFVMFPDICTFLTTEELPPTTTRKLLAIVNDRAAFRKLKIELAITVDSMEPFVKATCDLEGDGPLVLYAYQKISSLHAHVSLAHDPSVLAVADDLAQGNASNRTQPINYANTCYPPAYSYFKEKFERDLKNTVDAFKAAQYFLPHKINEQRPTISDMDSLKSFPFLDSVMIAALKSELAEYVAAAEGVTENVNTLEWWRGKEENNSLPNWIKALKLVLLVQPSSAAAERAFSILNNSFHTTQESALEEYTVLYS